MLSCYNVQTVGDINIHSSFRDAAFANSQVRKSIRPAKVGIYVRKRVASRKESTARLLIECLLIAKRYAYIAFGLSLA